MVLFWSNESLFIWWITFHLMSLFLFHFSTCFLKILPSPILVNKTDAHLRLCSIRAPQLFKHNGCYSWGWPSGSTPCLITIVFAEMLNAILGHDMCHCSGLCMTRPDIEPQPISCEANIFLLGHECEWCETIWSSLTTAVVITLCEKWKFGSISLVP